MFALSAGLEDGGSGAAFGLRPAIERPAAYAVANDPGLRGLQSAQTAPPSLRTRRYAPDPPAGGPAYSVRRPVLASRSAVGLLELWVNGAPTPVVARVTGSGPDMLVDREALASAGIAPPAGTPDQNGYIPLSALGLAGAAVDAETQQLRLATPPTAGPVQILDASASQVWTAGSASTGFTARYDLAAQAGLSGSVRGQWSVGASLGGSVFTPRGTLTGTALARLDEAGAGFVRLDTTADIEDPARLRRVSLGDGLSSRVGWSRAVRFAGVQLVQDFSLRPDMATLPSRDIRGEAVTPSTVDVFINSARVYSQDISPGPFVVRNIPLVTGRGEAVVVVRDTIGREVATAVPIFLSPELLAKGLTSFGVEVGARRRSYGLKSFDYGALMAGGVVRRGMGRTLTLEGHAEATARTQMAGAGAAFALGGFGAGAVSVAASHSPLGDGVLYGLSGQAAAAGVTLFGAYTAADAQFQDIAGTDGFPAPRSRLQLGGSVGGRALGSLSVSWISERRRTGSALDLTSMSYSRPLPGGAFLGAVAFRSLPGSTWAGQLFLRVPLGGRTSLTGWTEAASGQIQPGVELSRPADPDGGLGYGLAASTRPDSRFRADASWIGDQIRAGVGVAANRTGTWGQAFASGGVVGVDGAVFATRGLDTSFAVVKTGRPDVRVYRENREVARTDAKGRAVVLDLDAYRLNRISVALEDFPFGAEPGPETQAAAPRRRSGVSLDFTPRLTRPAMVVVRREDGAFPPAGSEVALGHGERTVIGRRGEIYLRDFPGSATGVVRFAGGSCRFQVDGLPEPTPGEVQRLGPVACVAEPPHGA